MAAIPSADGVRLEVRRVGIGPAAVFLHGSHGGLESWGPVAEHLVDDVTAWLVARRGYPPSDAAPGPHSYRREAADVVALVEAAHRDSGGPVHLVAGSHGGNVVLHALLLSGRDRRGAAMPVASVSLFEPSLFAAGPRLAPVLDRYRALVDAGDLTAAGELWAEQVALIPGPLLAALTAQAAEADGSGGSGGGSGGGDPAAEAARRAAIGAAGDLEAMVGDEGGFARWSAVDLPVLLMQGAESWSPIPETMDALAAALPDVERVTWAGQSHFATHTAPDLVADAVRGFIRRHPSP